MSSSQILTSAPPSTTPTPTAKMPTSLSHLWWNTNLPTLQHTPTCPSYLTYALAHPKERANLSTRDEDYKRQTWPAVRAHVAANRLDQFTRVPTELRRYRLWTEKLVGKYGSVMRFVLDRRLGWRDSRAGEGRFGNDENYKILLNDWPYGIDTRIVHLVVWTKFAIPSDPITDDLLPESRAEIEEFVRETFVGVCGEENVIWFRNWGALKSVHAVEHFHVMLFDPPGEFVQRVTGGDVSLAEKVERGAGGCVRGWDGRGGFAVLDRANNK